MLLWIGFLTLSLQAAVMLPVLIWMDKGPGDRIASIATMAISAAGAYGIWPVLP